METITYLHGLDLVAQSDGAATEYFAYDGLSSVRQMVDATGSPLLTQSFDPYGSLYARAGIAEMAWGFTGEYGDTNGLLYLRARYYATSQGRFFQLDPSRQEVNPYAYSYNNPLNYADPSGLFVTLLLSEKDDGRNLTDWLVRAMRHNAQTPEIVEIADLNRRGNLAAALVPIAGWLDQQCFSETFAELAADFKWEAYNKFRHLVRREAIWDFKIPIVNKVGENIVLCGSRECTWYWYENIANIHFGYVGKAAGFTDLELLGGAGVAQVEDHPGSKWYQICGEGGGDLLHFCDEPEDATGIKIGIAFYRQSPPPVTELDIFRRILEHRRRGLKPGTPQTEPLPSQYANPGPGNYGPCYPVEHFNHGDYYE